MKTLPFLLLCAVLCGDAAAQPRTARKTPASVLHKTQDSITRWQAAHPGDTLAENIASLWTDERAGRVGVRLLRADSALKARFRRRVSDSPLIRLEGFDPATTPFAPPPQGAAPPPELTMRAQYALYPTGTERVRLTIRCRGDQAVWFGTDYTLSRFQNGRWETLPVHYAWHSLLIGLGPADPPAPGPQRPAPPEGYAYEFTVWLAPKLFPTPSGCYRVSKAVYTDHPRRDWLLTTEFCVTPFVPFTRFSAGSESSPTCSY